MWGVRKKWALSIIISAVLKGAVVAAGLFMLGVATGIIDGTVPVLVSLVAIVGAYAIAKEGIRAVAELEEIIRKQQRYMMRRRFLAKRLNRKIERMHPEKEKSKAADKKQRRRQIEV